MNEIFKAKKGEEIEGEIVRVYEELSGDVLYEGDAIKHIIKANAYLQYLQGKNLEEAIKMTFLRTSRSYGLDLLGEFKNVKRLPAEPARVIVKFSRTDCSGEKIIPKGTRVTPDGSIYFETVETGELQENESNINIRCKCQTAGLIGNNFEIGQIKTLVDKLDFITSISNINKSSGGREVEDDESYRKRIQQVPESYSVAGSKEAYEFWARSADSDIIDVYVESINTCIVEVYPLLKDGKLPDENILNIVEEKLSSDKVRPLTDEVKVFPPSEYEYAVDIEYYLPRDLESFSVSIDEKIKKTVEEWEIWQKQKLGRDINTDELIYRIKALGVKRVNIISPVYTPLDKKTVAKCTSTKVTFKEVEDE